jgi:hypothetical protein
VELEVPINFLQELILRRRQLEKEYYSKSKVIDYVWQHSRYHGNLLAYCENISKESGSGFPSLIFLFNLSENIFKNRINDYDSSFQNVINNLRRQDIITPTEFTFLNSNNNSIRKLRNLLAHANLSRYNLSFTEGGVEVFYPLTEDETCLKLYDMVSPILFNLMLRIVSIDFINPFEINLDENINKIIINIKEFEPEELMEFKGIDVSSITNWEELTKTQKYRLAENVSDVTVLTEILKGLKNYLK